jgi:hypothetical protein
LIRFPFSFSAQLRDTSLPLRARKFGPHFFADTLE